MQRVKARISISRTLSSSRGSYLTLEIKDESSRCRIIQAEIDMEVFGPLVTGASEQPCEVEVYLACPLGKVRVTKTEYIARPECNYKDQKEVGRAILAPYEVDGWTGYVDNLFNFHERVDFPFEHPNYGLQAVSFHRFVDPPEESTE